MKNLKNPVPKIIFEAKKDLLEKDCLTINKLIKGVDFKKEQIQDLIHLLKMCRGTYSLTANKALLWVESKVKGFKTKSSLKYDSYGNLIIFVGNSKDIMFTSHIDTCHFGNDDKLEYQNLALSEEGVLFLDNPTNNQVLGADDGTGVAIMLHMIRNNVSGTYAFFKDEESGRVGSEAYLQELGFDNFKNYKSCISFDRAGNGDIITHQSGIQCISDAFANSLICEFASNGVALSKSDRGSFTDSFTFIWDIKECTNISVGYKFQHSYKEVQDIPFFEAICDAVVKIDWSSLPSERELEVVAPMNDFSGFNSDLYDFTEEDELMTLIQEDPCKVASKLLSLGIDAAYLKSLDDENIPF